MTLRPQEPSCEACWAEAEQVSGSLDPALVAPFYVPIRERCEHDRVQQHGGWVVQPHRSEWMVNDITVTSAEVFARCVLATDQDKRHRIRMTVDDDWQLVSVQCLLYDEETLGE